MAHRYQGILAGTVLVMLIAVPIPASAMDLLPAINNGDLPPDDAAICPIPHSIAVDYRNAGFDLGAGVADFTLHTESGERHTLSRELEKGKPVLLIAGSYTCDVFRHKVPRINDLHARYASAVSIFVVNVLEPHPVQDTSPYFGRVMTGRVNEVEGVLYRQPVSYGERRAIVRAMLADLDISPPVLLDSPCNEWWHAFGPAPNNAYLLDSRGRVAAKHGWFDKFPEDIEFEIKKLLGIVSTNVRGSGENPDPGIRVFPNPFSAALTVESTDAGEKWYIMLFDGRGRLLVHSPVTYGAPARLSTATLPKGPYLYQFRSESGKIIHGTLLRN